MTPEKWKQIKELFAAALEKDLQDRSRYLRDACDGDDELRDEIEALLASYDSSVTRTGRSAAGTSSDNEIHAEKIGPYQVVSKIGAGGMGIVYLAIRADETFTKKVAIKVVQSIIGAEEVLDRFRHERRILATLDHPNIAKLLDGGATAEGLPYFAMDYVEGERIDEYCSKQRLTVAGRLGLFRNVCSAVQYVHQNLVVHRDLKPSNILVTAEGVPKLLDFGIAKLLGPEARSELTRADARPMTPAYASPEQVRGEPVTTASDVYSLGVILYELLVGDSPYRLKNDSPPEMMRAVCEQDPEKPSAAVARHGGKVAEKLSRQLSGDLDNILLKAIQKDPQRRYASAEQFSEDLRRHLEGLPVSARRDTWAYRSAKFVRRHRAGVAAAALVVISLTAGLVTSIWQVRVARRERANAQQQFNDVRKLTNYFLFDFHSSIQHLPGSTPARKLLVQKALEYLNKLSQQATSDTSLKHELAEAYLKVGDVQGNPYTAGVGDRKGAVHSYTQALNISRSLVAANLNDFEAQLYLARSYRSLGEVLPVVGSPRAAADDLNKSIAILETLRSASTRNGEIGNELAKSYQVLADLEGHSGLQNLGDPAAAFALYEKALAIYQQRLNEDPKSRAGQRDGAVVRVRIADLKMAQGDPKSTINEYRNLLKTLEDVSAADVNNADDLRLVAMGYRKVGGALEESGDKKSALENYRRAASVNESLVKADPDNVQAGMGLAISLRYIGDLLANSGDQASALEQYQKVLGILERLSTIQPDDILVAGRRAEMLILVSDIFLRSGRIPQARAMTSEALTISRSLAARQEVTPDDLYQYATNFLDCTPKDLREPATAVEYARKAAEKSGGDNPELLDLLARAYFANNDPSHAVEAEVTALNLVKVGNKQVQQAMVARLARFRAATKLTTARR